MVDHDEDVIIVGELPGDGQADDAFVIDESATDEPLPKRAKRNPDGSVTLSLGYPVTVKTKKGAEGAASETQISELVMKRLSGLDMTKIFAADRSNTIVTAIALSSGINTLLFQAIYKKMDGADIAAAGIVVGYFLGNGQTTGR